MPVRAKKVIASLLAALALYLIPGDATRAQEINYPTRSVKIMIGFPVGGLIDIVTRLVGDKLSAILGQPIIVEARPGATGMLASADVAKAAPDGYTLLMINDNYALNPSVFKNVPYDSEKDFAPIGFVGLVPMIFTASPELAANTVEDVVKIARTKPGALTYASVGVGSQSHLAAELFSSIANIEMQHVPYRGGAPAINDLVAGHVDTMFLTPAIGIPLMRAGKLKPLATAADVRLEAMPNVPTMAEAGYPVEAASWMGLVAPAKTSPQIVAKLGSALTKVLAMPDVRQHLSALGAIVKPLDGKQFGDFVRAETKRWAVVVSKAGLQPQ